MSVQPIPAPSLTRTLIVTALPAYVAPLVMSGTSGLLIGDVALVHASYTSIAPPSALAALVVVLALHRRAESPSSPRARMALSLFAFAAFFALGSLVLLGLQRWDRAISLREAPLSFAIGAAISTTTMLRERAKRFAAGSSAVACALALGMLAGACAGAPPRPTPRARAAREDVIEGVRPETSRSYGFIVATCVSWAAEADAEATAQRTRQRRGGVVSTVAGILGTASGITGGALASQAHGDGDDDGAFVRSLAGGVSAMGFGLVATSAGIATSRAGRASGEASSVVASIEEAIARHTIAGLASMDPQVRDMSIVREGVALARECAVHASRFEPTASLGVPAGSPIGMRTVSNALVRARETNPSDEALAADLFGESVAETGAP